MDKAIIHIPCLTLFNAGIDFGHHRFEIIRMAERCVSPFAIFHDLLREVSRDVVKAPGQKTHRVIGVVLAAVNKRFGGLHDAFIEADRCFGVVHGVLSGFAGYISRFPCKFGVKIG